jgi:hypothetical protein
VLHLDAGDLAEGARQRLRFVLVRRDRFRHDADLVDALCLELRGRVDEPFQLGELLLFRQRRRLELLIDPAARRGFVGERGASGERVSDTSARIFIGNPFLSPSA